MANNNHNAQHNQGYDAVKKGFNFLGKKASRKIQGMGKKAVAKLGKAALKKVASGVLLKTMPYWAPAVALLLLVVILFAILIPDFSWGDKRDAKEEEAIAQRISEYNLLGQELMVNPTHLVALDMVLYDNQSLLDYPTSNSAYHFFSIHYERFQPAKSVCTQLGENGACLNYIEQPEKILESGSYSGKKSIQSFFKSKGQPLDDIVSAIDGIRTKPNVRLTLTSLSLESAMLDANLTEEQQDYFNDILESELIAEEFPELGNTAFFGGIGGGAYCSPTKEIVMSSWNQSFTRAGALSSHGPTIISLAKEYSIDPVLFAAIAFHESAYGKSKAILTKNNPGGLMGKNGLMVFSSLNDGLESMARTLHNRIIKDGKTTIEKLGSVYAPVGASNDPTGLNNHWVPNISKIVSNLGGLTMNCDSYTDGSTIVFDGDVSAVAKQISSAGTRWIGNSLYVFGGGRSQSHINKGWFDCSSFVHWAYLQGGINLGNLSSTSTETLNKMGKRVSVNDIRVGDLIFWDTYKKDGHVGIYIGNGRWIGAQSSTGVAIEQMSGYWNTVFKGHVRRILPEA